MKDTRRVQRFICDANKGRRLNAGTYKAARELAWRRRISREYVTRILRLSYLAPDIVKAILDGREPSGLSLGAQAPAKVITDDVEYGRFFLRHHLSLWSTRNTAGTVFSHCGGMSSLIIRQNRLGPAS